MQVVLVNIIKELVLDAIMYEIKASIPLHWRCANEERGSLLSDSIL
jgi:hypothetical protein